MLPVGPPAGAALRELVGPWLRLFQSYFLRCNDVAAGRLFQEETPKYGESINGFVGHVAFIWQKQANKQKTPNKSTKQKLVRP